MFGKANMYFLQPGQGLGVWVVYNVAGHGCFTIMTEFHGPEPVKTMTWHSPEMMSATTLVDAVENGFRLMGYGPGAGHMACYLVAMFSNFGNEWEVTYGTTDDPEWPFMLRHFNRETQEWEVTDCFKSRLAAYIYATTN